MEREIYYRLEVTKLRYFSKFSQILCTFDLHLKPSANGGKIPWCGSQAAKERTTKWSPGVAIRDYRCPEMLINLALTLGLLLVIKQP